MGLGVECWCLAVSIGVVGDMWMLRYYGFGCSGIYFEIILDVDHCLRSSIDCSSMRYGRGY